MELLHNSAKCLVCGEVLVSRHTHDYKQCSCENKTSVDGGLSYVRYGGKDLDKVRFFSVTTEDSFEDQREYFEWGTYGKDGDQPLSWIKLKDMSLEHLEAVKDVRVIFKEEIKYREKNGIH